ncbi:MAG: RNA methyltransferase [Ruthenibacterium sp.]
MNVITSRENETVKYACKIGQNRAFRQSERCFLAEGLKLCLDLARAFAISKVFYTSKAREACPAVETLAGVQYEISEAVAEKLSETKAPQGLFVLFQMPQQLPALRAGGRYLCLDNVQDPSNVGALLRSAAAFGFDGAILSAGTADVFCGKAVRSSMGAVGQIDLFLQADMPEMIGKMRALGSTVYAAALQNSVPLASVHPAAGQGLAVVIGNEGNGLGDAVIAACDAAVRIPMSGKVESLNAAVAGSVLLWHFREVP